MAAPLPMDKAVRYGKLPNGLTYYIRHNDLPEHHAEFFIAQKVGSVLEEESQRGLAHFLEHMAFNGLKNWPGKSMLDYLQRHGVKFGTNVNAYTSIDETVYNISDVPIDENLHPGIVDSCLLILHDWSGYISLEDEEIDNERGVIHEEWRSRNNARQRLQTEVVMPALLPDNRYGCRMPIGLMSVVDNFTYDELRNYYHRWYRPDLQGIFVVGDVDVDAVEKKIAELWQDIETPADAPERPWYTVEDNDEPLAVVASDPEMTSNTFFVYYKHDPMPEELKGTTLGVVNDLVEAIIESCLDQRLHELSEKPDCPFLSAGGGFTKCLTAKTKDAFVVMTNFHDGRLEESMQMAMDVVRSMSQYGITESELQRVKDEMMAANENAYNERNTRKNRAYVSEIQQHFLNNQPMPGAEIDWQLAQQIIPNLPLQLINQACKQMMSEKNILMYVMAQTKDSNPLPDNEGLLAMYRKVCQSEVKPYEDAVVSTNLIAQEPKAGKVKKVTAGPFDSQIWTLSNGAKVVWKKTDFKEDYIGVSIYSDGGSHGYTKLNNAERTYLGTAHNVGGLAEFNKVDLGKALAGKNASVSASISRGSEGMSGSATPKDLRTLMQLIHLNFTAPRMDQEAWDAMLQRAVASMQKQANNPSKIMSDSLTYFRYRGQEEVYPLQISEVENLNYSELYELSQERFRNAADFTFYFIGNIDEDSLRVLSETYLASLPAKGKKEKPVAGIVPTAGSREMRFDLPMSQPKTSIYNFFYLYDQEWSLKEQLAADMLGQVARMAFTNTVREQEGGAYSPSASAGFSSYTKLITFVYAFDTGAEKRERMEEVAYREFCRLAEDGITEDYFQKVRDYMLKHHQENLKENSHWMSAIRNQMEDGIDIETGYEEALNSITIEDLKSLAKRLQEGSRLVFVSNGVPLPDAE